MSEQSATTTAPRSASYDRGAPCDQGAPNNQGAPNDQGAPDDHGPISPELALVDPELAARAREALPARPVTFLPPPRPAPGIHLVAAEPPDSAPRERRFSQSVLVLLAAGVLLASVGSATALLLDRRGEGTAPLVEGREPTAPTTVRSEPVRQTPPPTVPVPAPPLPDPVTAPVFTWAPVAGAQSYRFVLFRGGIRIYEVVTRTSRHALPRRWTFGGKPHRLSTGTYRWVVIPRLRVAGGLRDGKAVVDASYTV